MEKPGQSLLVHLLSLSLSLSPLLHPKPVAPLCAVSVFRTQHCGVPWEAQGTAGPCVSVVGRRDDCGPGIWSSLLPACGREGSHRSLWWLREPMPFLSFLFYQPGFRIFFSLDGDHIKKTDGLKPFLGEKCSHPQIPKINSL